MKHIFTAHPVRTVHSFTCVLMLISADDAQVVFDVTVFVGVSRRYPIELAQISIYIHTYIIIYIYMHKIFLN